MNLESVAVVVFQSKDITGGKGEGETQRGSARVEAGGSLETVLILY